MDDKTIVILPDIQYPYHDPRFVNAMIEFIADFQPDDIVQIGDLIDQPEPSRWNRGRAGEFAGTLQASLKGTHKLLAQVREAAPNARVRVKEGNHDERVAKYVGQYAPALSGIEALSMPELLSLDAIGVEWESRMFEIAPGWVAAHGHEGSLNRVPGSTALSLAKRVGASIVCGHTHRLGFQHESTGWAGKVSALQGMEVGHAMTIGKAGYLATGSANWHQGFGILRVSRNRTHPQVVPVVNRSFIVDGNVYTF